jgi:hypothetical protein
LEKKTMKNWHRIVSVYLVVLPTLALLGCARARQSGGPVLDGLQATAVINKHHFKVGEPILVKFTLTNVSTEPKVVCFQRFELGIPDPNYLRPEPVRLPGATNVVMQEIQRRLASDEVYWQVVVRFRRWPAMPPNPPSLDLNPPETLMMTCNWDNPHQHPKPEYFVRLGPGQSCTRNIRLQDYLYVEDVFAKRGAYEIWISYENYADGGSIGFDAWKCRGSGLGIDSNTLKFTID